jgi:hypothetical protein
MRVAGALMLLGSAGCGVWLALQNSHVVVQARVGREVWTGHLYMVLIIGALLAAWFLLGIAFLVGRRRRSVHRHASRSARRAPAAPAHQRQYPPTTQYQYPRHNRPVEMQAPVQVPYEW